MSNFGSSNINEKLYADDDDENSNEENELNPHIDSFAIDLKYSFFFNRFRKNDLTENGLYELENGGIRFMTYEDIFYSFSLFLDLVSEKDRIEKIQYSRRLDFRDCFLIKVFMKNFLQFQKREGTHSFTDYKKKMSCYIGKTDRETLEKSKALREKIEKDYLKMKALFDADKENIIIVLEKTEIKETKKTPKTTRKESGPRDLTTCEVIILLFCTFYCIGTYIAHLIIYHDKKLTVVKMFFLLDDFVYSLTGLAVCLATCGGSRGCSDLGSVGILGCWIIRAIGFLIYILSSDNYIMRTGDLTKISYLFKLLSSPIALAYPNLLFTKFGT